MVNSKPSADQPSDLVCPWCSGALAPAAKDCPSCGAQLIADSESDLPGLTTVDPRPRRAEASLKSRNRLLSWISGDDGEDVPTKAEAQAVARPDTAVQMEILRLQIEADLADLKAEAASIAADSLLATGVPTTPDEVPPAGDVLAKEDAPAVEDAPAADDPSPDETIDALDQAPEDDLEADNAADPETEVDADALAAVDRALEREAARLELEAQIAELQARMDAITSGTAMDVDPPPENLSPS